MDKIKKLKGTTSKKLKGKIEKLKGHLTSLDAKHQLIKLKLVTTYIIGCMNIRTILSELLFVPLEQ